MPMFPSNPIDRVTPAAREAYKIAAQIKLVAQDLIEAPPELIESKLRRLRLVLTTMNAMGKSIYVGWGDCTGCIGAADYTD